MFNNGSLKSKGICFIFVHTPHKLFLYRGSVYLTGTLFFWTKIYSNNKQT